MVILVVKTFAEYDIASGVCLFPYQITVISPFGSNLPVFPYGKSKISRF